MPGSGAASWAWLSRLPFVLVLVNLGLDSEAVAVVAALSVLAGGFVLRCGVLAVGITEAPPLYRFARWRADRPVSAAGGRIPTGVAE